MRRKTVRRFVSAWRHGLRSPPVSVRLLAAPMLRVTCLSLLLLPGCGQDSEKVTQAAPAAAEATPRAAHQQDIQSALALWDQGRRDDAVRVVLELARPGRSDAPCRTYPMTEQAAIDRPQSELEALQQEMLDRLMSLRYMMKELLLRAEEAEVKGDNDTARGYIDAVKFIGSANRAPQVPLVVELVGKRIEELADEASSKMASRQP